MRKFLLSLIFLLTSCVDFQYVQYEDVVRRPVDQWSEQEALQVLILAMGHNLLDQQTNIKIIATPYYPSVILAMKRYAQFRQHWSDEELHSQVDGIAKDALGMYVDWENGGKYLDAGLNYLKDKPQFDSLQFLVTLQNLASSSGSTFVRVLVNTGLAPNYVTQMVPLVSPEQVYIPDISDLEQRISLFNDRGEELKPSWAGGRKNAILTMTDRVFVMFRLRDGNRYFLEGSKKMYLLVKGFEKPIRLEFNLAYMR